MEQRTRKNKRLEAGMNPIFFPKEKGNDFNKLKTGRNPE